MTTSPAIFAALFGLGGGELLAILAIVLILFGGAKLPQLAKGLGESIKEFKKASKEEEPKPAETKKEPEATKTHGSN